MAQGAAPAGPDPGERLAAAEAELGRLRAEAARSEAACAAAANELTEMRYAPQLLPCARVVPPHVTVAGAWLLCWLLRWLPGHNAALRCALLPTSRACVDATLRVGARPGG